jgi:hypothetical protein
VPATAIVSVVLDPVVSGPSHTRVLLSLSQAYINEPEVALYNLPFTTILDVLTSLTDEMENIFNSVLTELGLGTPHLTPHSAPGQRGAETGRLN